MNKYNAYVRWFDNFSGSGVVTVPELKQDFFVHWSADRRLDKYDSKGLAHRYDGFRVEFDSLDTVEVEIFFDSHYQQISSIEPKNWISKEDLLSDKLIEILDNDESCSLDWFDFCLNNVISKIVVS